MWPNEKSISCHYFIRLILIKGGRPNFNLATFTNVNFEIGRSSEFIEKTIRELGTKDTSIF